MTGISGKADLIIAVGFAAGFPATGIEVPFLGGGVTVTAIVALAVAVPGAPGFVGQFEWGCKLALEGVYGISGASAVGFAHSFAVSCRATSQRLWPMYLS